MIHSEAIVANEKCYARQSPPASASHCDGCTFCLNPVPARIRSLLIHKGISRHCYYYCYYYYYHYHCSYY